MAALIPDDLAAAVQKLPALIRWIENLRVTGSGVTFNNTARGATITINTLQQDNGGRDKRAILDLRYNTTTHWIQAAYITNPADEDWEDKIQFTVCPGISLAEFSAF